MKKPADRDPLMLEVVAAIGAGRIELGPIHSEDPSEFIHGLAWPDGTVRINLAPSVVQTVVHELLHRMRPTWTERAVRAKTTRLIKQLSDAEIDRLYTLVLSTATTTKKAVI